MVPIEQRYSHSLASITKAKELGYNRNFLGIEEAIDWYWNNLK
jgi:hypothetical protein